MGTMTTTIEEVDALLESLCDREAALIEEMQHVQDDQKSCDLILLALGLRKLHSGAELLQVEIGQIRSGRGPVAVELTDADGNVLVSGHELANTAINGWTVNDLLADLAVRNDGEWIKAVSSEHDDHWGECDCAIYLDGMEPFAIDLNKAAALPVPASGAVTAQPQCDEPGVQPEDETLSRLRVGLVRLFPGANRLYVTDRYGAWEADDLADSTGLVLRSGEPLGAELLPGGGYVAHAVSQLAETGYFDRLPRDGNSVGILMDPSADTDR